MTLATYAVEDSPVMPSATPMAFERDRDSAIPGKEPSEQRTPAPKRAIASRGGTRRRAMIAVLLVAAAAGGGAWWWFIHRAGPATELTLYGNIDLRQVALAFNNNERIATVLMQEGDYVRKGDLLARLDSSRLEPQVAQAEAQVAAQRASVARLHNGSRPEEVAQARATLASAKADAENARKQLQRKNALVPTGAAPQQDADAAKAAAGVADARVEVNQKALDLAVLGPRQEEIDQAEAQLRGNEAQLAYLREQLADAELRAPLDSVVRSRLMKPGEMASPQRPVFSLAVIDPKWVRTYVSERDLGKAPSGMRAAVTVDSFPGRQFEGWIGFVSPVAEFTPRTVETAELRTSLLYEVRVFVHDPENVLPLGMPATVHLSLDTAAPDRKTTP
jgi:HlyD family secretion protein